MGRHESSAGTTDGGVRSLSGAGCRVLRLRLRQRRLIMFLNMLATFAEFEVDLLKMRTREGMAIARAKGKVRGKQPKLTTRQRAELIRMHASGEYIIAALMEVFYIGRAAVYRVLDRAKQRDGS